MDHLLAMRWRDVLFAHWRVDPDVVAESLPPGLSVATYDGSAWLGVVTMDMEDIRPRGSPVGRQFGEVNVRTYVEGPDGGEGVYFYSLDAADRASVAVARLAYDLPYYAARIETERSDDAIRVRSRRVHGGAPTANLDWTYRPTGETTEPDPGSLEAFLVERYAFYLGADPVRRGQIAHPPWPLREATLDRRRESLVAAAGFEPRAGDPDHVRYSPGTDVRAGWLETASR